MQEEIQKVKLTEEREKGHSKGREVKDLVWAKVVLTLRTKRTCQSKKQSCLSYALGMGCGGALVEAMTFNRRVVGSTPALAAM